MNIKIEILRCLEAGSPAFWQSFWYEPENIAETVAAALTKLNERPQLIDAEGHPAEPIRWECNCLQKKCGACAMVINGRPALACAVRLADVGKRLRLEPLKKFPLIADLAVDRSIMQENLKRLRTWLETEAQGEKSCSEDLYEAARCLQCGCCLEVCPNYDGGTFTGMAAAVPFARILEKTGGEQHKKAAAGYERYFYQGCGKSLACHTICPAGIAVERLLLRSNAAVWKKYFPSLIFPYSKE